MGAAAIECGEEGAEAEHVEALVAAESEDDGAEGGGRRRGGVAEAEVLPEGIVVAGQGTPEAADAGGGAEGGAVESPEDFGENVEVIVD